MIGLEQLPLLAGRGPAGPQVGTPSAVSPSSARLEAGETFRPIQYLGSKLRLVGQIAAIIGDVGGREAQVCDLFTGTGTVAGHLTANFRVTAVDIQEYARVLAASQVSPPQWLHGQRERIIAAASESPLAAAARKVLEPLREIEHEGLAGLRSGDPCTLAQVIEHGSLEAAVQAPGAPERALVPRLVAKANDALRANPSLAAALLVTRYFGGVYFSYDQAIALDAILAIARQVPQPDEAAGVVAAALSAASWIVNTVGKQFAQPIRLMTGDGKPKALLMERTLRDRNLDPLAACRSALDAFARRPVRHPGQAVRSDYRDFLRNDRHRFDVIYADPPYTIDHYSRFYHVLETMALYDWPALATMNKRGAPTILRGLYRIDRHQSPFCIPSQAMTAFTDLFELCRRRAETLVLSYSPDKNDGDAVRPRMLGLSDIVTSARRYYPRIEVIQLRHSHRRLNQLQRNRPIDSQGESIILAQA